MTFFDDDDFPYPTTFQGQVQKTWRFSAKNTLGLKPYATLQAIVRQKIASEAAAQGYDSTQQLVMAQTLGLSWTYQNIEGKLQSTASQSAGNLSPNNSHKVETLVNLKIRLLSGVVVIVAYGELKDTWLPPNDNQLIFDGGFEVNFIDVDSTGAIFHLNGLKFKAYSRTPLGTSGSDMDATFNAEISVPFGK